MQKGERRGTSGFRIALRRVIDPYAALLAGFGGLVLVTAWLPMLVRELPLSLPIFSVALGAGIFALPGTDGTLVHPLQLPFATERLTEMIVLVALTGCGLKLDRPLKWANSGLVWRLLGPTMLLTVAVLALLGSALLGLSLAAALLLAGALAPTDPVLASDVQAGAPGEGGEDEIRYALTAEAGLNDGLAFPFVNLAVALTLAPHLDWRLAADWLSLDVLWRIGAGVAAGWIIGRTLGWAAFRLPNRARLSRTGDGFVALGITVIAFGLTELVHGYGFLAVFVSALAFRAVERDHEYHRSLHEFIEQLERLLMMALLFLFGASITGAGLLSALDGHAAAFALLAIFVVRPALGWLSCIGRPEPKLERAIIAFFGIRGVGSFYYLAFGLNHAQFEKPDLLWATVGLTVLVSVVLHGVSVTPIMRRFDRLRGNPLPGEGENS